MLQYLEYKKLQQRRMEEKTAPAVPEQVIDDHLQQLQSDLIRSSRSKADAGLKQSDAAQAIFERWFDKAKIYASEGFQREPTSNVHAAMRRLTMDALVCLVGVGVHQHADRPFLCRTSLDAFAARSLLEHATQILVLHSTKVKFTSLLTTNTTRGREGNDGDENNYAPSSSALLLWLQNVFCSELTRVACYRSALDSTRSQAIATLKAAVELGETLNQGKEGGGSSIQLNPCKFIHLAVQGNVDVSVRGSTGELITTICRCYNVPPTTSTPTTSTSTSTTATATATTSVGSKYQDVEDDDRNATPSTSSRARDSLTETIALRGMDDKAFTLGWRLGMLDNAAGVNILISRIDAEAQRHKSSSSNESMSLTGNSRPLVSAVLRSIYEVSMNWRNEDVQDLGNEGKFRDEGSSNNGHNHNNHNNNNGAASKATTPWRGDFRFDIRQHSIIMARVLRTCDVAAKSLYQERESANSAEERSQDFIEALCALLETYPDSGALLELILRPLTLEGLSTVAGLSDRFSIDTWCKWLLPFVRKQLDAMSLRGISGRQLEQEVVDLLRDCARHFYLNGGGRDDSQHKPTLEFGEQLYQCVIEAIRHGYIETEGFPRVAAVVIARHISEACDGGGGGGGVNNRKKEEVLSWVRHALSDQVCHSIKTMRAMHEIILTLLGLESSSGIGFDFDHSGGYGGPSSRSQVSEMDFFFFFLIFLSECTGTLYSPYGESMYILLFTILFLPG